MNIKKTLIAICSLLMLGLLPACAQALGPTQPPIPDIASLKENLPQLEREARRWRSDAVLTWVKIPIQYRGLGIITAGFDSPTVQESILLYVQPDGRIELRKVKHEIELEIFPVDDWAIDSPEAFELLLNEDGRKYLAFEEHRKCSSLFLDRRQELVVWCLSLWDCGMSHLEYYYLDAISGERLFDLDLIRSR